MHRFYQHNIEKHKDQLINAIIDFIKSHNLKSFQNISFDEAVNQFIMQNVKPILENATDMDRFLLLHQSDTHTSTVIDLKEIDLQKLNQVILEAGIFRKSTSISFNFATPCNAFQRIS